MSTNSSIPDGALRPTGPEPFVARTLSASLTVKDLERSLAWYQDVLGFIVDRKYEREGKLRAVALKAGDVLLLIGQDDGAKGWERVKGDGLSLTITTDQDVDAIAHRIKQLGGVLESDPVDMPMGGRIFRLQDPDGFKFAISSAIRPRG
jgi:predicted enzyme related to lactoylglutathione lyase